MKKRHEQKMLALSVFLLIVFNAPFMFVYNVVGEFFGVPVFYFFVFVIWVVSIVVSYIILKKHYG